MSATERTERSPVGFGSGVVQLTEVGSDILNFESPSITVGEQNILINDRFFIDDKNGNLLSGKKIARQVLNNSKTFIAHTPDGHKIFTMSPGESRQRKMKSHNDIDMWRIAGEMDFAREEAALRGAIGIYVQGLVADSGDKMADLENALYSLQDRRSEWRLSLKPNKKNDGAKPSESVEIPIDGQKSHGLLQPLYQADHQRFVSSSFAEANSPLKDSFGRKYRTVRNTVIVVGTVCTGGSILLSACAPTPDLPPVVDAGDIDTGTNTVDDPPPVDTDTAEPDPTSVSLSPEDQMTPTAEPDSSIPAFAPPTYEGGQGGLFSGEFVSEASERTVALYIYGDYSQNPDYGPETFTGATEEEAQYNFAQAMLEYAAEQGISINTLENPNGPGQAALLTRDGQYATFSTEGGLFSNIQMDTGNSTDHLVWIDMPNDSMAMNYGEDDRPYYYSLDIDGVALSVLHPELGTIENPVYEEIEGSGEVFVISRAFEENDLLGVDETMPDIDDVVRLTEGGVEVPFGLWRVEDETASGKTPFWISCIAGEDHISHENGNGGVVFKCWIPLENGDMQLVGLSIIHGETPFYNFSAWPEGNLDEASDNLGSITGDRVVEMIESGDLDGTQVLIRILARPGEIGWDLFESLREGEGVDGFYDSFHNTGEVDNSFIPQGMKVVTP